MRLIRSLGIASTVWAVRDGREEPQVGGSERGGIVVLTRLVLLESGPVLARTGDCLPGMRKSFFLGQIVLMVQMAVEVFYAQHGPTIARRAWVGNRSQRFGCDKCRFVIAADPHARADLADARVAARHLLL